jgi:phosphoribosylanthranilate isomerase
MVEMGTKLKICGITNLDDAELAAGAGAWAVGLVFHPASPRRCATDMAAVIGATLKRRCEVVGVFVNAPLDEVAATADAAALTIVQLHGEEGPAFCAEARRRTGLPVIKVARVRNSASIRSLAAYKTDYHLLDAFVPGKVGGTGERFDWTLAAEHPGVPPVLVSGGIRPDNVREAIETVRPFAIDVASGVEVVPGRKDPERLEALFEAVREATPAEV